MNMNAKVDTDGALPMTLSADLAHEMSKGGDLLIVDVRTPMEWMRSGLPEGAVAISPQNPTFIEELDEAMGHDKSKPIGLICATGNRSSMIQRYLMQHGYSAVTDISEGMMGNWTAVGWLRKSLPTVAYKG